MNVTRLIVFCWNPRLTLAHLPLWYLLWHGTWKYSWGKQNPLLHTHVCSGHRAGGKCQPCLLVGSWKVLMHCGEDKKTFKHTTPGPASPAPPQLQTKAMRGFCLSNRMPFTYSPRIRCFKTRSFLFGCCILLFPISFKEKNNHTRNSFPLTKLSHSFRFAAEEGCVQGRECQFVRKAFI